MRTAANLKTVQDDTPAKWPTAMCVFQKDLKGVFREFRKSSIVGF